MNVEAREILQSGFQLVHDAFLHPVTVKKKKSIPTTEETVYLEQSEIQKRCSKLLHLMAAYEEKHGVPVTDIIKKFYTAIVPSLVVDFCTAMTHLLNHTSPDAASNFERTHGVKFGDLAMDLYGGNSELQKSFYHCLHAFLCMVGIFENGAEKMSSAAEPSTGDEPDIKLDCRFLIISGGRSADAESGTHSTEVAAGKKTLGSKNSGAGSDSTAYNQVASGKKTFGSTSADGTHSIASKEYHSILMDEAEVFIGVDAVSDNHSTASNEFATGSTNAGGNHSTASNAPAEAFEITSTDGTHSTASMELSDQSSPEGRRDMRMPNLNRAATEFQKTAVTVLPIVFFPKLAEVSASPSATLFDCALASAAMILYVVTVVAIVMGSLLRIKKPQLWCYLVTVGSFTSIITLLISISFYIPRQWRWLIIFPCLIFVPGFYVAIK